LHIKHNCLQPCYVGLTCPLPTHSIYHERRKPAKNYSSGRKKMAKILVLYYSRSGNTRKMAEAVADGARNTGAEVTVSDVKKCSLEQLLDHDGIIAGSPTYYGLVAGPLKEFFDRSVKYHGKLEGKVGGAFSSAALLGGGNETAVLSILQMMLVHGMIVQGRSKNNHYGAVSIEAPDESALEQCRQLGERVSRLAGKLFG
jgi:NAD(P)H dehydrogenase (quinone)